MNKNLPIQLNAALTSAVVTIAHTQTHTYTYTWGLYLVVKGSQSAHARPH